MWSEVKTLVGSKKKINSGYFNEIVVNDKVINEPQNIANEFNHYFVNGIDGIVRNIDTKFTLNVDSNDNDLNLWNEFDDISWD